MCIWDLVISFNAPPGQSVNFRTIPEFFVGANGPGAVGTSGQAVPGGSNGTPFFVATGKSGCAVLQRARQRVIVG
jgi:hypothetical protein